jgi:hypothetical protein
MPTPHRSQYCRLEERICNTKIPLPQRGHSFAAASPRGGPHLDPLNSAVASICRPMQAAGGLMGVVVNASHHRSGAGSAATFPEP